MPGPASTELLLTSALTPSSRKTGCMKPLLLKTQRDGTCDCIAHQHHKLSGTLRRRSASGILYTASARGCQPPYREGGRSAWKLRKGPGHATHYSSDSSRYTIHFITLAPFPLLNIFSQVPWHLRRFMMLSRLLLQRRCGPAVARQLHRHFAPGPGK